MQHTTSLSLAAAARECGVSRPTIERAIKAGRLPNAQRNHRGHWAIPVPDLLAAGFNIGKPSPPEDDAPPVQHAGMHTEPDEHARLHARIADLEAALDRERAARAAAEALAEERLARIDDLKAAMPPRAIGGPKPSGLLGRLFGR